MSFKHCPDLRTFSFTMAPDDSGWRVRVLTGEHSREGGREEGREGEPVYTEGTRHAEVDDCLRDKKAVFKKKKERGSVGCFRDGVVSSGSEGGGGRESCDPHSCARKADLRIIPNIRICGLGD